METTFYAALKREGRAFAKQHGPLVLVAVSLYAGLGERFQSLEDDILELRIEMTEEFAAVRVEMAEGFADLRAEMAEGFAAIRTEMGENKE